MEEGTECIAADWQLPLAFSKSRHTETIEGVTAITQTWRMKERVIFNFDTYERPNQTTPRCFSTELVLIIFFNTVYCGFRILYHLYFSSYEMRPLTFCDTIRLRKACCTALLWVVYLLLSDKGMQIHSSS